MILADQPELMALAGLASVPASRMAAAFNDPEHFFTFLTLEELARLTAACERLSELQTALTAALEPYAEKAREILGQAS